MAKHEMNPETIYPPAQAEFSLAGDSIRNEQIEGGGVGTSPAPGSGMKRYPTEPPAGEAAPRARVRSKWSAAGAVAGAAIALAGVRLLRRRR